VPSIGVLRVLAHFLGTHWRLAQSCSSDMKSYQRTLTNGRAKYVHFDEWSRQQRVFPVLVRAPAGQRLLGHGQF
jgi:hypothetical protein